MSIQITDPDMFDLFLNDIKTRTPEENAEFVYMQWVLIHELKSNINDLNSLREEKNKFIATLEQQINARAKEL